MKNFLVYAESLIYRAGIIYDDYYAAYSYYTICEGNTDEEVLKDWANKNKIEDANFEKTDKDEWVDRGYFIRIIPLHKESSKKDEWLQLKWI